MMLPPLGGKCFSASCIARIGPRTLVSNSRWNSFSVTASRGPELEDSGIIHKQVDRSERLPGFLELTFHVSRLRHVSLNRDRPASLGGNFRDRAVSALLVGGIVHRDRSTRCRQALRDRRSDPFGCAGNNGHYQPPCSSLFSHPLVAFTSPERTRRQLSPRAGLGPYCRCCSCFIPNFHGVLAMSLSVSGSATPLLITFNPWATQRKKRARALASTVVASEPSA
jgi:hypothetical protein